MEHKTAQEITDEVNAMNAIDKAAKKRVYENMTDDEIKKIYTSLCLRDVHALIDEAIDRIKYDASFSGNIDMPVTIL